MSHFSFTRLSSDDCELTQKNKQSTKPFDLSTDKTVVESNDSCFSGVSPFMHNPFKSIPVGSVDVESDLRGQRYPLTKCNQGKYNPNLASPLKTNLKLCNDSWLQPEYTRINKSCNLAGTSINRFTPLCGDPTIVYNDIKSFGKNTRLQVKDVFEEKRNYKSSMPFTYESTSCYVQGIPCSYIKKL